MQCRAAHMGRDLLMRGAKTRVFFREAAVKSGQRCRGELARALRLVVFLLAPRCVGRDLRG